MTFILLEYSTLFDMESAVDLNNGTAAALPRGRERADKHEWQRRLPGRPGCEERAAIQCDLIPSANKSLPILGKQIQLALNFATELHIN